jgi:hypothetical protein
MANYAHIENNQITGVYDLLPDNWRNISNFSALNDQAFIHTLGWRTIVKESPDYNIDTQTLGFPSYRIEDDNVIETIEVINLPVYIAPVAPEPVVLSEEQLLLAKINTHINAMAQLRMTRDTLLTATDYTQLADVIALNGEQLTTAYNTYRQELRDLPTLYENDPEFLDASTAVYPVIPGSN